MTCSARSFSDERSRSASPSLASVVPAIGHTLARPASQATRRSGDEPTRASSGSSSRKRYGDGLTRRSARYSASGDADRRPLCALRRHDLVRVPDANVFLASAHHLLVARLGRRSGSACRARRAAFVAGGERLLEAIGDLGGIAGEHLSDTCAVVEAHELVDDDEPRLGKRGAVRRGGDGRLELRRVVVREVADERRGDPSASSKSTSRDPDPTNELRPSRPRSTDSRRKLAPASPRRRRYAPSGVTRSAESGLVEVMWSVEDDRCVLPWRRGAPVRPGSDRQHRARRRTRAPLRAHAAQRVELRPKRRSRGQRLELGNRRGRFVVAHGDRAVDPAVERRPRGKRDLGAVEAGHRCSRRVDHRRLARRSETPSGMRRPQARRQ